VPTEGWTVQRRAANYVGLPDEWRSRVAGRRCRRRVFRDAGHREAAGRAGTSRWHFWTPC